MAKIVLGLGFELDNNLAHNDDDTKHIVEDVEADPGSEAACAAAGQCGECVAGGAGPGHRATGRYWAGLLPVLCQAPKRQHNMLTTVMKYTIQ